MLVSLKSAKYSLHDFYLYVKEPLSDAYTMVKIALSKGFLSAKYFFLL